VKQKKVVEHPAEIRKLIRAGKISRPTCGLAPGYAQANLVMLPRELAFDFLLFCQRNPKPCPVLEVLEPGVYEPRIMASESDILTDIPLYRVYREGELVSEQSEISAFSDKDMVTFLLGCSFTFENALVRAGIPLRHIDQEKNVSMYITNIPNISAGIFSGPLVVTMRPIQKEKIIRSIQITSRFPLVHGAPIHIGSPEEIGIKDIEKPNFGDFVEIKKDEIPVFWACGVTPQAVAIQVKPSIMITHSPGYMFITDILDEDLAAF
jgi:uncharacterized protein YcsI (UPF0317 family)